MTNEPERAEDVIADMRNHILSGVYYAARLTAALERERAIKDAIFARQVDAILARHQGMTCEEAEDEIAARGERLERARADVLRVADEMGGEQIEITEIWQQSDKGGLARTHACREIATRRIEWAAALRKAVE